MGKPSSSGVAPYTSMRIKKFYKGVINNFVELTSTSKGSVALLMFKMSSRVSMPPVTSGILLQIDVKMCHRSKNT